MTNLFRLTMAVVVLCTNLAWAQTFSDGEVRKINKEAQKITLKHGPLVNLDMPPMTMVFGVSDPSLLDTVSVGDMVQFVAEKINGGYVVTTLRKAP